MSFITQEDYYPSISTYCNIAKDIDDSKTGTKDFKNHFITFDDELITCDDCIKIKKEEEDD
ncbi:hypothetical protein LCGC14_1032430 [marine sediment metagenome]|uniref:Uncharacterized protein n=1 Tax=marine sediment metagenome TaxID=412755 RepID=A0A0F9NG00_9ZZZZ